MQINQTTNQRLVLSSRVFGVWDLFGWLLTLAKELKRHLGTPGQCLLPRPVLPLTLFSGLESDMNEA